MGGIQPTPAGFVLGHELGRIYLDGQLDDVRLSDRALSASEIAFLVNP